MAATSFTGLKSLFKTLTQNQSSANDTLAGTLINLAHSYLLQPYFDNERIVTITTVGPQNLTLASAPLVGATSATLSSAWSYLSTYQLVQFSDGEQRRVNFIQGSATIYWQGGLIGTPAGSVTSASTTTNLVTFSNSNGTISNGQELVFAGASLPGGIVAGTNYYCGNVTNTTFKLFTDSGLSNSVTITSNGTGTFSAPFTTAITTSGVATYPLPANVSKLKNSTISVGQLVYTAAPVQSVQEWTKLNALPYSAEIVAYFFVYQGFLNFWPIPSETGDVIDLYIQLRVPNLSIEDYSTGSLSGLAGGSNSVTGVGTSWHTTLGLPTGTDIISQNMKLVITPPEGDGIPYWIQSVQSDTALTLYKPLVTTFGGSTASSYTIGQYPLLYEDFHEILVYWALQTYYGSIFKDADRYQMFKAEYDRRFKYMEAYLSTKSVNVDLDAQTLQFNQNPNLFPMANIAEL